MSQSEESPALSEPLAACVGTIPVGRTADWSIPYTLGAPLGLLADIRIPEPPDHVGLTFVADELAATTAPATTTREGVGQLMGVGADLDAVPRRITIVPRSRRHTGSPATSLRDPRIALDYPLSDPSLWPDAFDPAYAPAFRGERGAAHPHALAAAPIPLRRPDWVQRHRAGLVIGFGIVPFVAVPVIALLGTRSARLVTDLQVPQMSFILDWVIAGSVAAVASTLIGMRYLFRRRRASETAPTANYRAVGQES